MPTDRDSVDQQRNEPRPVEPTGAGLSVVEPTGAGLWQSGRREGGLSMGGLSMGGLSMGGLSKGGLSMGGLSMGVRRWTGADRGDPQEDGRQSNERWVGAPGAGGPSEDVRSSAGPGWFDPWVGIPGAPGVLSDRGARRDRGARGVPHATWEYAGKRSEGRTTGHRRRLRTFPDPGGPSAGAVGVLPTSFPVPPPNAWHSGVPRDGGHSMTSPPSDLGIQAVEDAGTVRARGYHAG